MSDRLLELQKRNANTMVVLAIGMMVAAWYFVPLTPSHLALEGLGAAMLVRAIWTRASIARRR